MAFPVPYGLSPSKVASFKDCALAFRFSAIDKLPEPSSPWAVKGTLVHRALELLFADVPVGSRTVEAALDRLAVARAELLTDPEFVELGLGAEEEEAFASHAAELVRRYFDLEDPNSVRAVGLELKLEAVLPGSSLRMRGIIDRLDLDDDGELIVTDYKTGRVPGPMHENARLLGVHFYAFLVEQVFGRRPKRVQLLYLSDPLAISTLPSDQSIRGLTTKTKAVWQAIELACQREDFRPRQSRLCSFCAYQELCPAFGGDPGRVEEFRANAKGTPMLPLETVAV